MIIVADEQVAESARAAGQLVCPGCGGWLRTHGFSRPRSVRTYGGAHRTLRPARVRCAEPACGRTHVLLPAWCVPGRGVDADTIGAALLAAANGTGHRPIADRLGIPPDTVRGWLRAARDNSRWLYETAVTALHKSRPRRPCPACAESLRLVVCRRRAGRRGGEDQALVRHLDMRLGMAADRAYHRWPPAAPLTGSFRLNPRHPELVKSVFFTTPPAALAAVARR